MQDVTPNANPEEAVQTRWNVLKKEVLYLDFRHELSSYDKYFYFGFKPNTTKMKRKQDLIRQYAPKLQEAYTKNCSTKSRSMKTSIPEELVQEELEIISKILGKEYVEAKILKHDFYKKMEGFSVFYKTKNHLNYSEAFAGSGETAVVKLVHDIYKAEKYTLVILDEPETSLHPAAQKHLVKFLLDQIKKKQLQIVISTHSSDLIEDMPKESIKVLFERKDNNKIDAIENVVPSEAFYHIGRSVSNKKTILVEDKLAKNIIEKTIQEYGGESLANMFQIKYFPGGESRLKLDFMPTYSKVKDGRHFFIFDGDMRVDKIDVNMLSKNDKSKSNLTELIRSLINTDPSKISFAHDSGNSGQELEQMLDLIKFHHDNVFFLPKNIPEEIIWDNEILTKADISISDKENIKNCLIKNNGQITATYKEAFKIFAKCMFDNDSSVEIEQGHNYFLKRWLEKKDDSYTDIVKTIEILKSYN